MQNSSLSRRKFLGGLTTGLTALSWSPHTLSGLLLASPAEAQTVPEWSPDFGSGQKVAVIGAGIAGLTAAYELLKAGFDVTVYEGTDRFGGRSLTVRPSDQNYKSWFLSQNPFVTEDTYYSSIAAETRGTLLPEQTCEFVPFPKDDGFEEVFFNAGPGRIPTIHTGILGYCREFGVDMEPYLISAQSALLQADTFNDGSPVQVRQFLNDARGHLAEYADKEIAAKRMDGATQKIVEKMQAFLRQYGDLSKSGEFQGTTRSGYSELPGAGSFSGKPRDALKLNDILNAPSLWPGIIDHHFLDWQTPLLAPVGGMDMIWQAFLSQSVFGRPLRDRIQLNHPVSGLRYADESRSQIVVESGSQGGTPETTVDYVILTGQPTTLLSMKLADVATADIIPHIKTVLMDQGGKYGWQAKSRFWEHEPSNIFGGISYTDHLIDQIWYPSDGWGGNTGILTGAYMFDRVLSTYDGTIDKDAIAYSATQSDTVLPRERRGTAWSKLNQKDRTTAALEGGEKLHPGFADKVYADQGLSIAWGNQAFQPAVSTLEMAEQRPETYKRLTEPLDREGRVYLAGDSISYWPGWQEGSVRSVWWALDLIKQHVRASVENR